MLKKRHSFDKKYKNFHSRSVCDIHRSSTFSGTGKQTLDRFYPFFCICPTMIKKQHRIEKNKNIFNQDPFVTYTDRPHFLGQENKH